METKKKQNQSKMNNSAFPFLFTLPPVSRNEDNAVKVQLQKFVIEKISRSRYRYEQVFLADVFNTLHLLHSEDVIKQWLHYRYKKAGRDMDEARMNPQDDNDYRRCMLEAADFLTLINKFTKLESHA